MSPQQATVSISIIDGIPLPAGEEFTGVIRVQDVRATEKDKVKLVDCFRGGDVVRGLVVRADQLARRCAPAQYIIIGQISLGDARSYYITTARNDLGVIFATSEAGLYFLPLAPRVDANIAWQAPRWSRSPGWRCGVPKPGGWKSANVPNQMGCSLV